MKNTVSNLFFTAILLAASGSSCAAESKIVGSFSVKAATPVAGSISSKPASSSARCNMANYPTQGRVEDETMSDVMEFLFRETPFKFTMENEPRFLISASFDSTLDNSIKDLATKTGMVYKKNDCMITFSPKKD